MTWCESEDIYVDAPFCAGPSLRECPGAGEVPETEPCPGNGAVVGVVIPDEVDIVSCEEDGTCDDSCTPPARGDCTLPGEVTTAPPPAAELPATGPADLLAPGLALVLIGTALLRKVRA